MYEVRCKSPSVKKEEKRRMRCYQRGHQYQSQVSREGDLLSQIPLCRYLFLKAFFLLIVGLVALVAHIYHGLSNTGWHVLIGWMPQSFN